MTIFEFCLIVLAMFYLMMCLISVFRLIKVITANAIKVSIAFYSGIVFETLSRAITMYLISINWLKDKDSKDAPKGNIVLYFMFVSPDMLNICAFILLTWYFYANFILSHVNMANDLGFFMKNDSPLIQRKTYLILYIVVLLYIALSIVISILTFSDILPQRTFFIINSILNLVMPVGAASYHIYLLVKYSGRPYQNEYLRNQSNRIFWVLFVWGLTRLLTGIIGLVDGHSFIISIRETKIKDDKVELFDCLAITIYLLVTEFLPILFALDYTFMTTYIRNRNSEDNGSPQQESPIAGEERLIFRNSECYDFASMDTISRLSAPDNQRTTIRRVRATDLLIQRKDIVLLEAFPKRKNGLGTVYKGTYKGMDVTCRQITFDRLSRYDLEGISKDIEDLMKHQHQYVSDIIGVSVDDLPNIYIVSPFYKLNLFNVLHEQKLNLDIKQRIEIAKKIAIGLSYLHENNVVHFHLSSKNIMLQDDFTPKISDVGFTYLKDIASIFIKYRNKNSYTCPEILSSSQAIANSATDINPNYDIYSYGMLFWEIYTQTIPFNVPIKTLIDYVVKDSLRPLVTKDFNQDVALIIRLCWDGNPKLRPALKDVIEMINQKIKI